VIGPVYSRLSPPVLSWNFDLQLNMDGKEMIPVRSSAISAVRYDASSMRLYIRFTGGGLTYTFCRVPQEVYEGLMNAPSKGTYYDRVIRDRYQC